MKAETGVQVLSHVLIYLKSDLYNACWWMCYYPKEISHRTVYEVTEEPCVTSNPTEDLFYMGNVHVYESTHQTLKNDGGYDRAAWRNLLLST